MATINEENKDIIKSARIENFLKSLEFKLTFENDIGRACAVCVAKESLLMKFISTRSKDQVSSRLYFE